MNLMMNMGGGAPGHVMGSGPAGGVQGPPLSIMPRQGGKLVVAGIVAI